MGIFDFLKREERAEEVVSSGGGDELIKALLSNNNVTREMALEIPEIAGTIDLVAGIIASTPIKLYTAVDGKVKEISGDHRLRLLNDETGDTMTANEFWRAITEDYYLGKGGYAYINTYRNTVASLHYVKESEIAICKNFDPIFKDFDIYVAGNRYYPWQFIRILRNTKDGASGTPITAENSKLISVAYSSLKYELNAARRGGNKKGFLKSEKKLEDSALKSLRSAFARLYSDDTETSEPFIVLNGTIDFKESSNTLAEMQLNENKTANAKEFAKLFHVSPEAVSGGATDTSTIAKLAAIPLMNVIQSALNRDLLKESEKGIMYFAFDTKELLKGDITERYNAYKTALDANFMQPDEVRYLEDLEPLGLNFIKLGLQDVLYNPDTKEIFTPNTGKMQTLENGALSDGSEDDIIEPRANPNHDPKTGRFSTGNPGIVKSGTGTDNKNKNDELSKTKEFMTAQTEALTDEQKEILTRYTGNFAAQVNTSIKMGTADRKYSKEMELLDSALKDGIMPEKVELHRMTEISFLNLGVKKGEVKNNPEDIIGKVVKNPIYTSTSFEKLDLIGRDTEILMTVPKGYKGCQYIKSVAHTQYKAQEEVLFKRGMEYVITDAKYQNDKFILKAEVRPNE